MSDQPVPGAMPTEPPATGEPQPPEPSKSLSLDEMKAELEKAQRALLNKTEETARIHKKLESLEKAEEERKKAAMTEAERLKAELEETRQQYAELKKAEQRRAAAEKVGLPLAFAPRLQGETPDELEADAKSLLEALPKAAQQKTPAVAPTNPGSGASTRETVDQQRARVYGTGFNVLDPGFAKAHGGGVIWNKKGEE